MKMNSMNINKKLYRIVTGGQTGVDRAALDAAISLNFDYGGWCPKNRIDEKDTIPEKYKNLKEVSGEFKSDKENYDARTKKNIEDSDATLIITPRTPLPDIIRDGTILTIEYAKKQAKPYLIIDLSEPIRNNSELIIDWIQENRISILNIGGPRESTHPGIYRVTLGLLQITLPQCKNSKTNNS